MRKVSVIVLSGGNSSRFGEPKFLLKTNNGLTFLECIVNEYLDFGCEDVVLVLNRNHSETFKDAFPESFRSKLKIVYNSNPELGRFYSLKLGASAVSDSEHVFIQNIDNPFTDLETLERLYENRKDDGFVSPTFADKGGHPVLLSQSIIKKIKNQKDFSVNIKDFLRQFTKITVDVSNDKILANINTPEEYESFFQIRT